MNQQNQEFQAWVGHILDLYRLASFQFSNPHSYTKFRAIKSLAQKTDAEVLIETGTYLGVTTNRCAPFFKKVYTIELNQELAEKAKNFLSKRDNVDVVQGDALQILPTILQKETVKNSLIFLDGHFSGGITACGELPEPAIEELKLISKYKDRVNAVIIDDFRLFGQEDGFPNKSTLFETLENYLNEFEVTVHLDQVVLARKDTLKSYQK
jgi:hypothetical protein